MRTETPRARVRAPLALLIVPAMALGGCNLQLPSEGGLDIAGGQLESIDVSGDTLLVVGDSTRLSATGSVSGLLGMLSYDPLNDARWSVSDPSLATIRALPPIPNDSFPAARAMMHGVRAGSVTVTVSARGIRGTRTIRVAAASSP